MSKISTKKSTNKVSSLQSQNLRQCNSNQYPWFSFRYMTQNTEYTVCRLRGKELNDTLYGLYNRLDELAHQTWAYWLSKPKASGIETIAFKQLRFAPNPVLFKECHFDKNSSVYVIRFDTYRGKNKGRIIGVKDSPCAVLHIIGYDFDFSAYNHS